MRETDVTEVADRRTAGTQELSPGEEFPLTLEKNPGRGGERPPSYQSHLTSVTKDTRDQKQTEQKAPRQGFPQRN